MFKFLAKDDDENGALRALADAPVWPSAKACACMKVCACVKGDASGCAKVPRWKFCVRGWVFGGLRSAGWKAKKFLGRWHCRRISAGTRGAGVAGVRARPHPAINAFTSNQLEA